VAASSASENDTDIAELRRENARLRAELDEVLESRSFRLGHAVVRAAARVLPGKSPGSAKRTGRGSGTGSATGRPEGAPPAGAGGPAGPAESPGASGTRDAGTSPSTGRGDSAGSHGADGSGRGAADGGARDEATQTAAEPPATLETSEAGSGSSSPLDEVPPLAADSVGPRTPVDLLVDASRVPAERLESAVASWRTRLPDHARLLVVHGDAPGLGSEGAGRGPGPRGPGARVVGLGPDVDLEAATARFGPARSVQADENGELPELRESTRRSPMVSPAFGELLPTEGLPSGPVFVGGTGRSGTWVIGRMLRHHPNWITVHTELRFHSVPAGFVSVLDGSVTPERFADRLENKWFRISGGSGNAKGLQIIAARHEVQRALRKFLKRAESDVPQALGELLLELIEPYARGRGAVGWAETTPYNAHAAHALLTALPSARLVHTVRDGRDVASSVSSMPWGPDSIEEALDWWASRVLQASLGVAAADPGRVHTVRLEELVHLEREATYRGLLEFLDFEDHEAVRRYFDEQIDSKRGNVGRWRKQVDKSERDRIDGRYRELLDELRDRGMDVLPTEPDRVDELAGA
jgi:hypothetical protein